MFEEKKTCLSAMEGVIGGVILSQERRVSQKAMSEMTSAITVSDICLLLFIKSSTESNQYLIV